ncbi:RidA family protein [Emticicia sp. TH156]|uniref:RidA family protein n=1 Tax=Emticicia sp. TH156 TaxID=2067454 RepID=UPI000C784701|nr:RidA family protein [Emticicia sp. TH156]PLK45076.1 enamine deaminase RidA [Emticicia sp. TH156]
MITVQVSGSLQPAGHYAHAVVSNGLVFTSGILPIKIKTSEKLPVESGIEEQAAVVFDNLKQILAEAGSDATKVVKTTVYITDGNHWGVVNQLYATFFGNHKPARSIIPVKELHFGYQIELEAVAEL